MHVQTFIYWRPIVVQAVYTNFVEKVITALEAADPGAQDRSAAQWILKLVFGNLKTELGELTYVAGLVLKGIRMGAKAALPEQISAIFSKDNASLDEQTMIFYMNFRFKQKVLKCVLTKNK